MPNLLTVSQVVKKVNLEWNTGDPINLVIGLIGGASWETKNLAITSPTPEIAGLQITVTKKPNNLVAKLVVHSDKTPLTLEPGVYQYQIGEPGEPTLITGLATVRALEDTCEETTDITLTCRNLPLPNEETDLLNMVHSCKIYIYDRTWACSSNADFNLDKRLNSSSTYEDLPAIPANIPGIRGITHIEYLFMDFIGTDNNGTPNFSQGDVAIIRRHIPGLTELKPEEMESAYYNQNPSNSQGYTDSFLFHSEWRNPPEQTEFPRVKLGQRRYWELNLEVPDPAESELFLCFRKRSNEGWHSANIIARIAMGAQRET